MPKFISTEKLILLGFLLFGITSPTVAVSQSSSEVSSKTFSALEKATYVGESINNISSKCDKCDGSVKNAIDGAKRDVSSLKQTLNDLKDVIGKACK